MNSHIPIFLLHLRPICTDLIHYADETQTQTVYEAIVQRDSVCVILLVWLIYWHDFMIWDRSKKQLHISLLSVSGNQQLRELL